MTSALLRRDYLGSTRITGTYVKIPAPSFGITENCKITGDLTVNGNIVLV
jgi:hypothetical protein